jgi:hypothetical protein
VAWLAVGIDTVQVVNCAGNQRSLHTFLSFQVYLFFVFTTTVCCLLSSVLILIVYAFFIHSMRAACPAHTVFTGFMTDAVWEAAKNCTDGASVVIVTDWQTDRLTN